MLNKMLPKNLQLLNTDGIKNNDTLASLKSDFANCAQRNDKYLLQEV